MNSQLKILRKWFGKICVNFKKPQFLQHQQVIFDKVILKLQRETKILPCWKRGVLSGKQIPLEKYICAQCSDIFLVFCKIFKLQYSDLNSIQIICFFYKVLDRGGFLAGIKIAVILQAFLLTRNLKVSLEKDYMLKRAFDYIIFMDSILTQSYALLCSYYQVN